MEVLAPELLWTGTTFASGWVVRVTGDRIAAVEHAPEHPVNLPGRALLPGFVNAHSHAFQRGLRGRGERFPAGAGSFWSWREAMYALVGELDETRVYELSRQAFEEMLSAGITSVGEFHYVHHGGPLAALEREGAQGAWALDEAVLRAARDVGIRLVLLQVYYRTGAIGKPLEGAQRRFAAPSPEAYWAQWDRLVPSLDPATQTLGCVVHSIRGASLEDLREVHAEAKRRGLVFHMHLEEQRREIEDCRAAYGRAPLAVVLDELDVDERFTCVHGTHAVGEDLARFAGRGANLCIAPTTEANLGDGLARMEPFLEEPAGSLCLGTDSNARISMLEEMRWLELGQRLRTESRGVVVDAEGRAALRVLEAATRGGARSLGLDAGRIAAGSLADFVAVDLRADALDGVPAELLADALVFGTAEDVLAGVCVGGSWRSGVR